MTPMLIRSLITLLVAIGVCVAPATAATTGSSATLTPIPLSRALDQLAAGRADTATLVTTGADAELHLYRGGRHFVADTTSALSAEAVAAARAGSVPLSIERPTISTDLGPPIDVGGGFSFGAWVQTWGPMLLLAALVIVSAMALRTVGGGRFGHRLKPVRSTTTFDDVAGIDEIRDDVAEIADILKNPGPYERLGAQLPKGVILHGPPGTGKTLLARAVAGEAGVPFFSASGSEFVEVYAGLGSRRIRSLFAAARKAAPAVVYIDEIDAVGGRRTGHAANGEREQTLDQLLTEMDGFRTDPTKPVVVLASTNRLDELDPALVRSGRFDRKIAVGLPSRGARREILDVHLRERPLAPTADAGRVAAMTVGLAGADLAALCNEAAFEAARAGDSAIDLDHFRRALLRLSAGPERRSHVMSDEERRLVAYHEMGHALVGHLSPSCDQVDRVTVIPQGGALGVTISLPLEDRFLVTRTECTERLAMMLAGRAAEELVFGECTSGAADDLERASRLARSMAGQLAMAVPGTRESLLVGIPNDHADHQVDEVERAAQELLGQAFLGATRMLTEHRELLERGAAVLLEREALDHEEIVALFGARPGTDRLAPLAAETR
ncbi:MAG: AAA family ATPase [Thermoleophilia bacterium]|nr:AAA family ATPase [Thermoleophilia bacterium]